MGRLGLLRPQGMAANVSSGMEAYYPAGKWLCCICIEFIPIKDLFVDKDGQKWDHCIPCDPKVRRNDDQETS